MDVDMRVDEAEVREGRSTHEISNHLPYAFQLLGDGSYSVRLKV